MNNQKIIIVKDNNLYRDNNPMTILVTKNTETEKKSDFTMFTKIKNDTPNIIQQKKNIYYIKYTDVSNLKVGDCISLNNISSNNLYFCLFLHYFVNDDFKIDIQKIKIFNSKINKIFDQNFKFRQDYLTLLNDLTNLADPETKVNLNDDNIKIKIKETMEKYLNIFYKNIEDIPKYFEDIKIDLSDEDYVTINNNKIRLDSLLNNLAYFSDTNIKIISMNNDKIKQINKISVNDSKNEIILIRNKNGFNLCHSNKILAIN